MTDGNVDDAKTGVELIAQVEDGIKCVIGDTAGDTASIYAAAGVKGAEVDVPPVKVAVVSRSKLPPSTRDTTVRKVDALGRKNWREVSGYHRQGRVENTFFRLQQIFGDKPRARHTRAQAVEAARACRFLNRVGEMAMPKSVTVSA